MSLDLTKEINVYNYNQNLIFVETSKEKYKFNPSKDGVIPSFLPMTINEIKWIASNTNIFHIGVLDFDEDIKEELYKELRIFDTDKIYTNAQLRDMIQHPTLENMRKLLEIENETYFERVRTQLYILTMDGVDVSSKMRELIDYRYSELQRRIRKSAYILPEKDIDMPVNSEQVKSLEAQNQSLQNQLDEMKKMMETLMNNQGVSVADAPKKRGRKPKDESNTNTEE